MIVKILKKMKHGYGRKWSAHLANVLWACRISLKTAIRFSPFSLVYGTKVISPVKLVIPTPRVVFEEIQEGIDGTNSERRLANLEGLEEELEVARRKSQLPAKDG